MPTPRVEPARQVEQPNWRKSAACLNDPNPNRWVDLPAIRVRGVNNPAYDTHIAELSATCKRCPVANECLRAALHMNVRGVFAGTDEFDRADLRDQLNIPTPPRIPPPENDEDARLLEQSFTALRLARQGKTNTEIARALGVSPMTISRLTATDDSPAVRRTKTQPSPAGNRDSGAVKEAVPEAASGAGSEAGSGHQEQTLVST